MVHKSRYCCVLICQGKQTDLSWQFAERRTTGCLGCVLPLSSQFACEAFQMMMKTNILLVHEVVKLKLHCNLLLSCHFSSIFWPHHHCDLAWNISSIPSMSGVWQLHEDHWREESTNMAAPVNLFSAVLVTIWSKLFLWNPKFWV